MKELTKAEEQIMQELWPLEKAFVKDIIDRLPDPKPAYNTVSTIIRILERKGFIDHYTQGKNHQYFPIISKTDYTKLYFRNFLSGYFNNSFQEMVSFKENQMTLSDLEEIIKEVGKDLEPDNPPSNE
jgi:BlaI family transcriptional regulator, penicillinase repressor